ncbi:COMM domain-containing protein 2 [Anthonomus grandis grandis]|uniref:COMM domain-containing protein 2 n=1 Tax=Anthonomus grandis grandis TaxID=2921223 RepID=UPI00216593D2|nr:COMM domain-containing protein 2 [Anthonomus grandis grandis]
MLISLRNDHKQHLQLLIEQPEQVVLDFCKLASDFIENGPNKKIYQSAASKLSVTTEDIQNCIYGIINLVLLACRHKLSEADFRDSVLTLGFSTDQEAILSKFYETKKDDIHKVRRPEFNDPHFNDLDWRFEVQLASRSLLQQVTPLITMDLSLRTSKSDGSDPEIEHHLLQTDPTNLVHLANELENALNESKSNYSRKIQKTLKNMQL